MKQNIKKNKNLIFKHFIIVSNLTLSFFILFIFFNSNIFVFDEDNFLIILLIIEKIKVE